MDLATGSVCITIAIVSAIVIYYILVSSMQEKSYDEAKAEHKKNIEKYSIQEKSLKEKIKHKKNKKNNKSVKQASSDVIGVISEEIECQVDISENGVPEETPKECTDLKEANEVNITKSIENINKQNPSNKKAHTVQPNIIKELKCEKDSTSKQTQSFYDKAENGDIPEKSLKLQMHTINQTEDETSHVKTVPVKSSSLGTAAKNKKDTLKNNSSRQRLNNEEEANINIIMPLVHKAELSRPEIQVLIDLLLNKQGTSISSSEWIEGKQDPVLKLKKQLAEKEKMLREEQEAGVALQSKLRDLRSELNSERHLSRQLEETLQLRQADFVNLSSRLQHITDDKQSLQQQMQKLQGKLSEEHHLVCRLQEELDQSHNMMQQELLAQRQQLEMHMARITEQHQEKIATLELQTRQMATQLQEQQVIKGSLNTESTLERERKVKLQESAQCQDLAIQIKVSSDIVEEKQFRNLKEAVSTQVASSMQRPATEGRENGDPYESKHMNISKNKYHDKDMVMEKLKEDIVLKEKEIACLKSDSKQKESLLNSLKNELSAAQLNCDKLLKDISSYKCLSEEQESIINALRDEGDSSHVIITNLRADICNNMGEIARLSKDCVGRDQLENKELIIEKLICELNTHKTKLADQEAVINSLREEIEKYRKNNESSPNIGNDIKNILSEKDSLIHSLQSQSSYYQEEIKQLNHELISSKETILKLNQELNHINGNTSNLLHELESQRQKNDELRTKNWKAMDALKSAESLLETKMKHSNSFSSMRENEIRLEEQQKIKLFLQRIFPDIYFDNGQEFEVWLEQFILYTQKNSDRTILVELEKQNCQLQSMVTHYKTIIADTEGMLNQLQNHIEEEEKRWELHIHQLESQLENVLQERHILQL